jgi:hypothetical protein
MATGLLKPRTRVLGMDVAGRLKRSARTRLPQRATNRLRAKVKFLWAETERPTIRVPDETAIAGTGG